MNELCKNMESPDQTIIIKDPGQALRPAHKQTKFTRKKKLQVLEQLGKEFNISQAAAKLNIHRKSLIYAINHDEAFKAAVDDIKDAWLDKSEGSGLRVAILPTREGYNDRKLFLTAHRPETYAPRPEVQINTQINFEQDGSVKSILSRIVPE